MLTEVYVLELKATELCTVMLNVYLEKKSYKSILLVCFQRSCEKNLGHLQTEKDAATGSPSTSATSGETGESLW